MRSTLAAAALLLAVPLSAQAPKVPVYVTSIGAQGGLTDPSKDNRDTVKNLVDDIKDTRELVLVERPEDAAIILTVLGRQTEGMTAGAFGYPDRDRTVRVRFQAGELTTDLSASARGGALASGGAWSKAAGKIVDQVKEWVKANRSALR